MQALAPFLALAVVVIFFVAASRAFAFQCPRCGAVFKVPPLRLLFSLHLGFYQYTTCPQCGFGAMMRPYRDR